METARLTAGQKYENIPQIIEAVNLLLVAVTDEGFKLNTKIRLISLKKKYDEYKGAILRKKRNQSALDIEELITKWNKHVSTYRRNQWANQIPTINTKPGKSHGHVKEKLDSGFDSIEKESLPETTTLSVCSHKRGTHNYPCCILTLDNLKVMVKCAFNDPSLWKVPSTPSLTITDKTAKSSLHLKCQMIKTDHCPTEDNSNCGSLIPFKKILSFFPLETKKEYSTERIMELYMKVVTNQYPDKIKYCKKPTCPHANKGFFTASYDLIEEDKIYCETCHSEHYVHSHKIICPDPKCKTTYCEICQMSPYHDMKVCQGPKPNDMNEEDYKLLLQTTRPCPGCKARGEKLDGCDHMNCKCGTDWCWRCLQKLNSNNPYKHNCLSGDNIAGERDHAFNEFGNDLDRGGVQHPVDLFDDSDDD